MPSKKLWLSVVYQIPVLLSPICIYEFQGLFHVFISISVQQQQQQQGRRGFLLLPGAGGDGRVATFDNLRPANSPRLAVLCFLCEDKVSYTKLWRQFQEGCILFSWTSNLLRQTWHFESLCSHSGGRWWIVVCSCVVPLPLTAAVCVCCVKVATHPHPHGSEEKATPDRPTKRHGVSVSSAVFRHATLFSVLILLSGNGDTSDRCEDSDIFTRLCWINTSRLEGSVSCVQQTHTGGDNVITPCVFLQVQVVQR